MKITRDVPPVPPVHHVTPRNYSLSEDQKRKQRQREKPPVSEGDESITRLGVTPDEAKELISLLNEVRNLLPKNTTLESLHSGLTKVQNDEQDALNPLEATLVRNAAQAVKNCFIGRKPRMGATPAPQHYPKEVSVFMKACGDQSPENSIG